ncbi:hypothetical protein [Streptomyces sp. NRRL F-5126]|uniref:hypothetical protein n=1 Tax=Streptomyces sp. NRRL F-5126 TaxID=1463857 RepID=UPI00131C1B12|nr:hypothetical protein [Streptomyces sp. NRRL F-5126]
MTLPTAARAERRPASPRPATVPDQAAAFVDLAARYGAITGLQPSSSGDNDRLEFLPRRISPGYAAPRLPLEREMILEVTQQAFHQWGGVIRMKIRKVTVAKAGTSAR